MKFISSRLDTASPPPVAQLVERGTVIRTIVSYTFIPRSRVRSSAGGDYTFLFFQLGPAASGAARCAARLSVTRGRSHSLWKIPTTALPQAPPAACGAPTLRSSCPRSARRRPRARRSPATRSLHGRPPRVRLWPARAGRLHRHGLLLLARHRARRARRAAPRRLRRRARGVASSVGALARRPLPLVRCRRRRVQPRRGRRGARARARRRARAARAAPRLGRQLGRPQLGPHRAERPGAARARRRGRGVAAALALASACRSASFGLNLELGKLLSHT
jgi:hypothetical protein